MFIFELFSYSQKQRKQTLHSGLFDPEMLFPEAGKMDFITFWEQLLEIELPLPKADSSFWDQEKISGSPEF